MTAWNRCAPLLLTIACATAPPAPVVPGWQRGSERLEIGEREHALREEAAAQVAELEAAGGLVDHEPLESLAAEVLESVLPVLDERAPALRVRIMRSHEREAAALPDGQLLLSLGLLAALESEAELAALIAHEAAHVVLRHRLISAQYENLTASTVDRQRLSRAQEKEADQRAIEWTARAGYDARGMLQLLHKVGQDPEPAPHRRVRAWESHPDLAQRIRAATRQSHGAKSQQGRIGIERYAQAVSGARLLAAELLIEAGDLDRARWTLGRYLEGVPDSGRAHFLQGEIARRLSPDGRQASGVRASYERAVDLAPEDPEALRALGLLLRESGEWDRAREVLERYLQVAPDAVDRVVVEGYLD